MLIVWIVDVIVERHREDFEVPPNIPVNVIGELVACHQRRLTLLYKRVQVAPALRAHAWDGHSARAHTHTGMKIHVKAEDLIVIKSQKTKTAKTCSL